MAINYPSSLDNFVNPAAGSLITNPPHGQQHADANDAIEALQAKVGISAGTPTANKVFVGSGNGTSIWGTAIGNLNLGTPAITAGTANNQILGTPTLVVGSDATGDLHYRSAGGTLTRLGVGSSGQYLTSNGTTPSWGNQSSKIAQVVSVYDTALGTLTTQPMSALSPMTGTITVSSGSRVIVMANIGYGHSTIGKRVGVELVVNGGTFNTLYASAGTTDVAGNGGAIPLFYRSGTLASGARIVSINWSNTDNAGSAYTATKSLVMMEELA